MIKDYMQVLLDYAMMETERLLLRPVYGTDLADIYEYGSDPQVTQYLTWETMERVDQAKVAIDEIYSQPGIYGITLKASQKLIGVIDLRLDPDHDKGSFGYVLNRDYWGRGYMTECLEQILWLAFHQLRLNRMESTHYLGNEASGRVMVKCGMIYEGTGVQELMIKGNYVDVIHYAMLQDNWEGRRSKSAISEEGP